MILISFNGNTTVLQEVSNFQMPQTYCITTVEFIHLLFFVCFPQAILSIVLTLTYYTQFLLFSFSLFNMSITGKAVFIYDYGVMLFRMYVLTRHTHNVMLDAFYNVWLKNFSLVSGQTGLVSVEGEGCLLPWPPRTKITT